MQTEILRRARGRPSGTTRGEAPLSLSDEELEAFRQETKKNHTTHLQFELMLFLGLRISELAGLRVSDLKRSAITVQGKKYGLPASLSKQLRRHVRRLPKNTLWLFPGMKPGAHITKIALQFSFNRLRDRAGLNKKYSTTCLRHTTAVQMVCGGAGPVKVQRWLRLKDLTATMRYFGLNANSGDNQERRRQLSYERDAAGNIL